MSKEKDMTTIRKGHSRPGNKHDVNPLARIPPSEVHSYHPIAAPNATAITNKTCSSVAQSSEVTDYGGPILSAPSVALLFWGSHWVLGNPTYSMSTCTDAFDRAMKSSLLLGLTQYRNCGGYGGSITSSAAVTQAYSNNGISSPGDPPLSITVQGQVDPAFEVSTIPNVIYNAILEGILPLPLPTIICVVPPENAQNVYQNADGSYSVSSSWGQHLYQGALPGVPNGFYHIWINQAQDLDSLSWVFTHELCESCSDAQYTLSDAIRVSNYQPQTSDQGDTAGEICDICQGFSVRLNGVNVTSYWSGRDETCITPFFPWDSLTGAQCSAKGGVQCVSNQDGRIEIFMIGSDAALWHNWQTTPGGAWSGWSSLGVPVSGFQAVGVPTVVRNADGRLEAFITDGQTVAHIWQVVPNGGWSTFQDLGSPNSNGIQFSVVAANDADGRIEIFVVATNGELWHMWQTTPSAAPWSAWGVFPNISLITPPAIANNADGRLEVFAIRQDGSLAHIWQVLPNGGWSSWGSLGQPSSVLATEQVSVCANQDGRLEVFGLDVNGAVCHIWQVLPNGGWSQWSSLQRPAPATPIVVPPVAVSNQNGAIEVFAQDHNGNLWHIWQTAANNGWSIWQCLSGGDFDANLSTEPPTVGRNQDGRLKVFAVRNDFVVGHEWQLSAGGAWRITNMVSNCYP